jgi:hypothetical protein
MAQQGVNIWTLAQKLAAFNSSDRIPILYGASTANTSNSIAQTATISITNLFANSELAIVANTLTTNSSVILVNLPTSNPHVNNQLWSNNGVLMVSGG